LVIGFYYGGLQKSQSIEAFNSIDIGYDLGIGSNQHVCMLFSADGAGFKSLRYSVLIFLLHHLF
jgi:hypothetical protein